ncbi:MAG: DUF4258 domain-containing protein [Chloroflexi bacterium]|nr:DUF4258 domain-containing protein [Chloroflexota bacterium]
MDTEQILNVLKRAVREEQLVMSLHATEEALAEHITRPEIEVALLNAQLLEDYPEWWLGPSCLIYGQTYEERDLHIVVSYSDLPITIITVYEPCPPKWITPTTRGELK